jgi:hypothetical protein
MKMVSISTQKSRTTRRLILTLFGRAGPNTVRNGLRVDELLNLVANRLGEKKIKKFIDIRTGVKCILHELPACRKHVSRVSKVGVLKGADLA